MTAPARPRAAIGFPLEESTPDVPGRAAGHWYRAAEIRDEWLRYGLDTRPADRVTAQHHLAAIYARLSRPRPRFVWVDSPHQARQHLAGLPTLDTLHRWIRGPQPPGKPPLASDLVAGLSRLRGALDGGVGHPDLDPARPRKKEHKAWPVLPPLEALAAGVPLREVLRQSVREALRERLADGCYLPVRAALGPLPVCWYGQQESYWIAHYDALRRLGFARYGARDEAHLDDWAALARSCGWWWPGEEVCVIVERPASVAPGSVRYRDGWCPQWTS